MRPFRVHRGQLTWFQVRGRRHGVDGGHDERANADGELDNASLRAQPDLVREVIARKRKVDEVDIGDPQRVYTYFMDEKRSVQWLREQQGTLVFEEISGGVNGDAAMGDGRWDGSVGSGVSLVLF